MDIRKQASRVTWIKGGGDDDGSSYTRFLTGEARLRAFFASNARAGGGEKYSELVIFRSCLLGGQINFIVLFFQIAFAPAKSNVYIIFLLQFAALCLSDRSM